MVANGLRFLFLFVMLSFELMMNVYMGAKCAVFFAIWASLTSLSLV